MRLGRPQTGSCRARWRSCVSPAAIACVGPPHVAHDQAAEQREAGDRHGDEGQHACRDLAAGLASACQAKRAMGSPCGSAMAVTCASRRLAPDRRAGAGRRVAARRRSRCSNASSIYLTEMTIGAAALPAARSLSEPTATAATMAGLLDEPARSARRPAGLARILHGDRRDERLPARRRAARAARSRTGDQLRRQVDRADIAGGRERAYSTWSEPSTTRTRSWSKKVSSQLPRRCSAHCGS